jgi:hypothetical protein
MKKIYIREKRKNLQRRKIKLKISSGSTKPNNIEFGCLARPKIGRSSCKPDPIALGLAAQPDPTILFD